ncbi:hypothetical protein [Roseinatronobacter sp. NSM]|uniref:hypothetical protein n=1 Tax=Roseinatronobacter sp. NSM TaxID=3457785 RepID=UPI004036EB17
MAGFQNDTDSFRIGAVFAALMGGKRPDAGQSCDKIDMRLERMSNDLEARLPCRGYFRY